MPAHSPLVSRRRAPPRWLRALGEAELPERVDFDGRVYRRLETLKHDFFAATGLYEGPAGRIICKIGRTAPLLGLPMSWLGRAAMRREAALYELLHGLPGIPRWIGFLPPTGFAHEYVEGRPLRKNEAPDDDFFPRLARLLDEIHARCAAYVDLEKRENILVGDDGRPYLIDFQISWYAPARRGGGRWPWRVVLRLLQSADRYHLLKHRRRHRPDQLSTAQRAAADRVPWWIWGHRLAFGPITRARRRILTRLGARTSAAGRSEEQREAPRES
jgi:hypothetical protein